MAKRRKKTGPAEAIHDISVDLVKREAISMTREDWPAIRAALWKGGYKVVKRKMRRRK